MSEVTFFIAPGATTGDPVQDKLLRAHEDEAMRLGVEFWNYGKVSSENAIYSKVSGGHLESNINPKTMEVRHRLTTFEEKACADEQFQRDALEHFGKNLRRHVLLELRPLRQVYADLTEFAAVWEALDKLTGDEPEAA